MYADLGGTVLWAKWRLKKEKTFKGLHFDPSAARDLGAIYICNALQLSTFRLFCPFFFVSFSVQNSNVVLIIMAIDQKTSKKTLCDNLNFQYSCDITYCWRITGSRLYNIRRVFLLKQNLVADMYVSSVSPFVRNPI